MDKAPAVLDSQSWTESGWLEEDRIRWDSIDWDPYNYRWLIRDPKIMLYYNNPHITG